MKSRRPKHLERTDLLHPDTFSDFPEPHPAVPCSGKFMPDFPEQLTTFGKFWDKKRWDVSSNSERLEAPELPARFKSFRSIQIGPFWYKKELSGKSYLLLSLATLLALLQGVCSKTDFPERISRSPLETASPPQRVSVWVTEGVPINNPLCP